MGSVHKETDAQGKSIHEYDNINYCDENVLRQLILNRRDIDLYYENRIDNGIDIDKYTGVPSASDISPFYEMIIIMYIDLDNLIKKARLTEYQRFLVDVLMQGYTIEDFVHMHNKNIEAVNLTFDKAIYNLIYQAEEDWKLGLQWDKIKTKTEWKQCSKCEEWLPKIEYYFDIDKTKHDGFKYICKNCRDI